MGCHACDVSKSSKIASHSNNTISKHKTIVQPQSNTRSWRTTPVLVHAHVFLCWLAIDVIYPIIKPSMPQSEDACAQTQANLTLECLHPSGYQRLARRRFTRSLFWGGRSVLPSPPTQNGYVHASNSGGHGEGRNTRWDTMHTSGAKTKNGN